MIKRTLYFGNPAYLNRRNEQLVINIPNAQGLDDASGINTIPIEDIGIVILDHQQITITHSLISALIENNVAIIHCNETHHPSGLMMPLASNTTQTEKFRAQIDASMPLKKNLWQQTVIAKINNQAAVLKKKNKTIDNMLYWAKEVKSGDTENHEARAAAYYWQNIFPENLNFRRSREGLPPNPLLNYGYAILRASIARGLVASGLLPTLGIFHRNKYNAYCLADDIMEPYRPFVDQIVLEMVENGEDFTELTNSNKAQLLKIPALDIVFDGERSPLMVGIQKTTSSLVKCFEGKIKKIAYPELI
jgi:CRISPR-associated protein Cas1